MWGYKTGTETFRRWTHWRHNSKGAICRQSWFIYLCQSSSRDFYTSLNIITPSIPSLCCLIIYLPLLSTCHSFTLFSCRSFSPSPLSLFYLPMSSLSAVPFFLQSFIPWSPLHLSNQVVSAQPSPLIKGVLQPRRKRREKWISPLFLSFSLSLSLRCGGCSGDNSEPTSISISGTAQRPARPPTRRPVSRFTACYFSRWKKKKARRRDGQKGWEQGWRVRKRGMI